MQQKKARYLDNRPTTIQSSFKKVTSELDKYTEASFIASLAIAKSKKPHNIGEELIKPILIDVVSLLCGENAADKMKKVPLSDNTVKRRIDDMATECEDQLIAALKESKFAIQLDESTTITNEALLLLCVRYIERQEVKQELLFSCNLDTTTKGEDIFSKVDDYFRMKGLSYDNLVACCSDGAAAMMGKNRGFNARLKSMAPHCKIIHCVVHRQALAAKKLSPELHEILQTSVKIINQIKAKALNSRLFKKLCEENDEDHTTLLLHTEVRWLSRGRTLGRLFELRESVTEMLNNIKSEHAEIFADDEFQAKLAYLVGIFDHFNRLNRKLQGDTVNIVVCKQAVDAFIRKLSIWHEKIDRDDCGMFQELSELFKDHSLSTDLKIIILTHLNAFRREMIERFEDIADADEYSFVIDPFSAQLQDVKGDDEEEELIEIQSSINKRRYFEKYGYNKFWLDEGLSIAPRLTQIALEKCIIPFATSYLAETTFSAVIHIKTKSRNRLEIHNDLRMAVTKIKPNIRKLTAGVQDQGSH